MRGGDCAGGIRAQVRIWTRILLVVTLAAGSAQADVTSSELNNRVQALTQSLASGAAQYAAANAPARAALGMQLRYLAAERRSALLGLIGDAPGDALKAELPSRIANRLPAEVRDLLEYRGELEGELTIAQIDHKVPEKSFLEYSLVTDFGERVSLHFVKKPKDLLSGARVVARGLIVEGNEGAAMALEFGETDLEIAFCCTGGGGSSSGQELPNTLGAQSTAVLLVNFTDDPSQPWTVAEIDDVVFGAGGVSDYFHETSHNQTWLTGDSFGWLTIDPPTTACELFDFADAVYQAAADAGIDLTPYDRRVIFTPDRAECGFAGVASIGGSPSVARLNGRTGLQVVTHEVGHNFGLHHGHSLDCGLVTLAENCAHQEYGDRTDTMGSPDAGHVSAFHKQRLGWLTEAVQGELQSVTVSSTLTLEPYETLPGSQPKSIRIPAGVDPANGGQRWLYLTYRQPIGFDSFYADRSFSTFCRDDVTDGIYGHLGTDGAAGSSYLLNMRVSSCWVDFYGSLDWFNPRLAPGETFVIPDTGTAVTVTGVGPEGANVYVDMTSTPPCITGDPSVNVASVGDNWGAPDDVVDYTVTVTSTDGAECDVASFSLSTDQPSGWGASFADPVLSLAPGATGSTTLSLTSATGAANGTYDVPVTAANGADTGSDIATYVVNDSLSNQPPVALDDSASTDSKTPVTIDVLANDSDPDNDPLSVVVITNPGKGSAEVNNDGTITYTPGARAKGSDSFSYTVSDGTDTADAVVEIAFAKGSGGGGGKGGGNGKGGKP